MIDLSYSDLGLKFNSNYYINAIKDCIDSINEGTSCEGDKIRPNIYIYLDNGKISTSGLYLNYINEICRDIDKKLRKRKLYKEIKVFTSIYDDIYEEAKKFRNIILGSNIITYFAVKQNVNDIENMTVVAFQFGPLNLSFKFIKNELIKKVNVYKDDGSFYIENPLVEDFYITYTDLNLLN
jgi:hypothetical protein